MSKFDKEEIEGMIFASLTTLFVIGLGVLSYNIFHTDNTSSPIEELYHKQLVTTLDSILDARFGPGCCEEDIDTVSANTFNTRFGGNLSPID